MEKGKNQPRRMFLKRSAQSAMGLAAGAIGAPALLRSANPSDVIGVGVVGFGNRGKALLQDVLDCRKVEVRGVCDIYKSRLQWGIENCKNPNAAVFENYRDLLDCKDIDAVVFGTPDHQHAMQTIDACNAGKDVYCEKCMTHTLAEAKEVMKVIKSTGRVYQLGHQLRSYPTYLRAKEIVDSGALGQISYIKAWHHRNSTVDHPWRYHLDKNGNPPADATPENIRWDFFLMGAQQRPFDVFRFLNWRVYREYGEGIAGDLQSHALDSINMIMGLGIPQSCVASGGIYYWDDGREIPDVWSSVFEWPGRSLQIDYNCILCNGRYGWGIEFHGKDATMTLNPDAVAVYPESVSPRYEEWIKKNNSPGENVPVLSFDGKSGLGYESHMENFFKCMRSRKRTRCSEDDGFEESVTAFMSIESYEKKKRVEWDSARSVIA